MKSFKKISNIVQNDDKLFSAIVAFACFILIAVFILFCLLSGWII